jgi:hypothetical protein
MKTLNSKLASDIFTEFTLTNEEMIFVRGGDGEIKSNMPPVVV